MLVIVVYKLRCVRGTPERREERISTLLGGVREGGGRQTFLEKESGVSYDSREEK